jgi:phosphopantetheinyl transferase
MWDVIVLHAVRQVEGDPAREQPLLERLPYAYRLALEQRDPPDRAASLQALGMLDAGLRRVRAAPLDPSRLHFPEGGKPSLEGGPHFSISHCARHVAVAVSEQCSLGLDVEDVDAHGRSRLELERWTAVEATLKAIGAGLRRAPDVRLSPDRAAAEIDGVVLHLRPITSSTDFVATLATREPVRRVEVEELGRRGQGTGDRGQ